MGRRALCLSFLAPVAMGATCGTLRISPAPALDSFSLTPPQLNAVLASHLDTDSYDALPISSDTRWMQALNGMRGQLSAGEPETTLLVAAYDEGYLPDSLAQTSTAIDLESCPAPESFDALVSTHLARVAMDGGLVDGFEHFAREVEKAIGTEVEWPEAVAPISAQVVDVPRTPTGLLNALSFSDESARPLLRELSQLESLVENGIADSKRVLALRLSGLKDIAARHGRESEQYLVAARTVCAAVEALHHSLSRSRATSLLYLSLPSTSPVKAKRDSSLLAPFRTSAHTRRSNDGGLSKRQPRSSVPVVPTHQECFSSLDSCEDSTSSCNGHGKCVVGAAARFAGTGQECWVCACAPDVEAVGNGVRTTYWAGEQCERIDYSGDFALLFFLPAALLLIVGFSVVLLFRAGQAELPSVLASMGGGAHHHKNR